MLCVEAVCEIWNHFGNQPSKMPLTEFHQDFLKTNYDDTEAYAHFQYSKVMYWSRF